MIVGVLCALILYSVEALPELYVGYYISLWLREYSRYSHFLNQKWLVESFPLFQLILKDFYCQLVAY